MKGQINQFKCAISLNVHRFVAMVYALHGVNEQIICEVSQGKKCCGALNLC